MTKETFWFRHDYDAADDDRTMVMIEQLGLEGYGIYWVLIEKLRGRKDYKMPFSIIPSLARRYMTTPEKMKTVIMQYGLFQYDDEGFFYSESLIRRMNALEELKQRRAIAGKKAVEARWSKEKDTKCIANEYESYSKRIANEQQTNTDAIRLDTDKIRIDKIRIDKIRIDKSKEENKEIEDKSSTKKKKEYCDFVERMYALYPTKCPIREASLGKSYKDKERIQKLLRQYTESEIESVFKNEIEEKYGKHYMQNFSTFLNNFPDPNVLFAYSDDKSSRDNEMIIGGRIYR
jgi:hypothetical protein